MSRSEITNFDQKMKDRFESLVVKDQTTGCWGFQHQHRFRYKQVGYNPRYASYCLYKQIVPKNTILKRKCGNLKCVNPEHLEVSTKRDIDLQRFERRFVKGDPSKCWEWLYKTDSFGYGYFSSRNKNNKPLTARAHRISYDFYKGEIPEGMCVCHRCDNPKCVNPEHLWLGTVADNVADKVSKNRQSRYRYPSIKSGRGKLDEQQVKEIREKYKTGKYSQRDLGKEYGVGASQIGAIVNYRTWKNS